MMSEPLDVVPLWCFFLVATATGMLTVEGGYRLGKWRHVHASDEKDGPVGAMVGSILGLLAIMLAFTFHLAATRIDARRHAVLEEANAIGAAHLRARLLPDPQRSEINDLLRSYTEIRVQSVAESRIAEGIARSQELHQELWSRASAVADQDRHSIMTGLFIESLNQVINLHSKRVFVGLRSRIPISIWLALFALAVLGMASMGYQAGLSGTRRSPEMPILTLAFAGVLFLIVDLDRADGGSLRVSQQPLIDVLKTMQAASPEMPPGKLGRGNLGPPATDGSPIHRAGEAKAHR